MKNLVIAALCLAATCSASPSAISNQFHKQDGHGGYAYGYEDHNSQKHEHGDGHGNAQGGYSYVDGDGKVQSVKYIADAHSGFKILHATNLPKGPSEQGLFAAAPQSHYGGGGSGGSYGYVAPWDYDHSPVVIGKDGVPIDTPAVQHARAAHLAAVAHAHHHLHKRSIYAAPIIHNGVPIDTPEVQHAKAAHLAAHAAASHGHYSVGIAVGAGASIGTESYNHGQKYPQHFPVIHNGVPVETPEVQHAKSKHFAALAEAKSRAGAGSWTGDKNEDAWNNDQGSSGQGNYGPSHQYHGPQHIPVIHNGVPVETPEVQHAKAAHFAALAEAKGRSYDQGYNEHWDNGSGNYGKSW